MTVAGPTLEELEGRSGRPRALLARRVAICVVYLTFSAVTVMIAYGGGALTMMAGNAPAGLAFAYGAVTAMKLLSFGGCLVIVATAGRSVVAVQWVLVGHGTWFIADLIARQDPTQGVGGLVAQYLVLMVVYVGPWLLLAPERWELFRLRARPDRVAVATALLALPLLGLWTWRMAHLQTPLAESNFDAVAIPLIWATTSFFAAVRPSGRRWLLGVVAAFAFYLGVVAVVSPSVDIGSPGLVGGLGLVLFAGIFTWRARQPVPTDHGAGLAGLKTAAQR
ncbi:MAG: hypothetical protein WAN48_05980 [Actinomycetes bacterium]